MFLELLNDFGSVTAGCYVSQTFVLPRCCLNKYSDQKLSVNMNLGTSLKINHSKKIRKKEKKKHFKIDATWLISRIL